METIEFAGLKFEYEKLDEEKFEKGPCAFKMIDKDGDVRYIVVAPHSLSERTKEIKTPNDGHLCAFCPDETSALMVAASIGIASTVATGMVDIKPQFGGLVTFDVDALRSEVNRLRKEGKSVDEVREILKPRMEEFVKKDGGSSDDKKEGGEW